jgi:hypothetical protein
VNLDLISIFYLIKFDLPFNILIVAPNICDRVSCINLTMENRRYFCENLMNNLKISFLNIFPLLLWVTDLAISDQ